MTFACNIFCTILRISSKLFQLNFFYYPCVEAYRVCEFDRLLHALAMVEPCLETYLEEVGVYRWSRAHSKSHRYDIMTTNISECVNAILVKERELQVTALSKEMRCLVQIWHHECQTEADKCKTNLTPFAEASLSEQYQLLLQMRISIHRFVTINICQSTCKISST